MLRRAFVLAALPLSGRAQSGVLRLSVNEDYAPYSYVDQGRVLGVIPDALALVLAQALPNLKLAPLGLPWRRAQAVVQNGEADALCTFASDERRSYAEFGQQPLVTLEPHLFFRADHPRRDELSSLRERTQLKAFHLVDQRGNQWAETQFADFPQVEWVGGHDAIYRMVLAKRGDVHVALSPLVTQWRLRKLGLQAGIISVPAPYVAPAVPFHLGIRRSLPQAQEWLAAIDAQLALPRLRKQIRGIERRYAETE
ncbi:polar amino acid transport system substrate-binding protein [Inhella inkyongensis]|uniref:Polar amino acid transport system substrate-binding protein n=1 Tax=Inhella inkyongensis TaxID=392593 RepID=A0A840S8F8_9BURK|nr:transporter substrate-binding domain-containing protein [Inhella inkyongensis]MBB5205953.1 polar amino acid transport system substrate-binding protein [Inhella inkyongensis]